MELGTIGKHLGSGDEKAGNAVFIFFIALLLTFLITLTAFLSMETPPNHMWSIMSGLLQLLALALGYFAGKQQ